MDYICTSSKTYKPSRRYENRKQTDLEVRDRHASASQPGREIANRDIKKREWGTQLINGESES